MFKKNSLATYAPFRFFFLLALLILVGVSLPSMLFAAGDGPNGSVELDGATGITSATGGLTTGFIESGATGTQTDTQTV